MARRFVTSRKVRSVACANIILQNGFFNEWRVYCYNHPKIKSFYRLANLFLLNKKMRYKTVDKFDWSLNMDNLFDRYYEL